MRSVRLLLRSSERAVPPNRPSAALLHASSTLSRRTRTSPAGCRSRRPTGADAPDVGFSAPGPSMSSGLHTFSVTWAAHDGSVIGCPEANDQRPLRAARRVLAPGAQTQLLT